jgi:predicted dehydrogenase
MLAEPARRDDIVIIATPPATHTALGRAALASGRHVLCEKPLAMSRSEAESMLMEARVANRLLACCSCRFLGQPTTEEVKRLLHTGELGDPYHLTFVHRQARSRSGIEYQPQSRWFLDSTQSGGGVLMDWGPYDVALLHDLLAPVRVDVLAAWIASPSTDIDPRDVPFDVETHAGASLHYHLPGGARLPVTYERASCSHGQERANVELECTLGAVRWEWIMWSREGTLTRSFDRGGTLQEETMTLRNRSGLSHFERPLHSFYRRIHGESAPILINEDAVFAFSVLRAIYDCAGTSRPQTVATRQ